jgi:hypothetical protein
MNGTALVVSMLRTAARVLTYPYNHSYIDFVCSPATWRLSVLTCHVASQCAHLPRGVSAPPQTYGGPSGQTLSVTIRELSSSLYTTRGAHQRPREAE